jgi:hypothetical protein
MVVAEPSRFLPEEFLREWVDLLVRLVEAAGAVVIFFGVLVAVVRFVRVLLPRRDRTPSCRSASP